MFNRIITLFAIARKLALSDALKIFSKHYDVPILVRIFVSLLSISFSGKNNDLKNLSEEERLAAIASLNPPGDRNNTSNFINLNSKENVFTKLERANTKVEPIIINRDDTSGSSDTQVAKNLIANKGNPWKAGTYVTNY